MALKYSHIVRDQNPTANAGGYKNVFLFARRDDFLALSKPPASGNLGDVLKPTGAHSFTDPKGFISWDCATHSVTLTGATVGEDGSKEMEWTGKFQVLGDSATTQEQMQRTLNDDIVCLLKEAACLEDDSYVQLGNECVSPSFSVEFDGKTTKEGKKIYTVTVVCKVKYFYEHAVTMSTETEA